MSKLRTALDISEKYVPLIREFSDKDILGFKLATTLDIFMFAAAIGLSEPKKPKGKSSYLRTEYITKAKEKALFQCLALGTTKNDQELEKYSDLESCFDMCEECAENGFRILESMANEENFNKESIESLVALKLDYLYTQLVESDI